MKWDTQPIYTIIYKMDGKLWYQSKIYAITAEECERLAYLNRCAQKNGFETKIVKLKNELYDESSKLIESWKKEIDEYFTENNVSDEI